MAELSTVNDAFSGPDCAYYGEKGDWVIAYAYHRDSNIVEFANARAICQHLGGENTADEIDGMAVERAGHWAVGWVDYIIIDPTREDLIAKASAYLDGLEDYPILDDDILSSLEWDEYQKTLADALNDWARKYGDIPYPDEIDTFTAAVDTADGGWPYLYLERLEELYKDEFGELPREV